MDKNWSEMNKEMQGYHSKTLAYSVWHIFRIEDIVAHEMIAEDQQVLFSRHRIMHIEAMQRIKNRLCKLARKGADLVAYCGFSCNHCFLSQWCGSCRTAYNTCSFATISPDGKCPNEVCCQEKGIDGCYECNQLETCEKLAAITSGNAEAIRRLERV